MQDQPSTQYGKDGFQTHQQGCDRRLSIFLGYHLKGIGDTAGQYSGVKQRKDRMGDP